MPGGLVLEEEGRAGSSYYRQQSLAEAREEARAELESRRRDQHVRAANQERVEDPWDPEYVVQAQFDFEDAFIHGRPTAWDVADVDAMYDEWTRGAVTPQARIFHASAPFLYGGALAALWSVLRHPQTGPVTQARHDQARELAEPFQRPPVGGYDFTPSIEQQARLSMGMAHSQMAPVTFRATDAWGVQNLPVINWARTRGMELVTDLSEQQLATTQGIILNALGGNMDPATVAPLIELTIDLHPTQAKWVQDRLARDLASGMPRQDAYLASRAFTEQLLRQRASTIARTEIMAAENMGQLEAWRQAARDGLIPKEARKVWVVGPGACTTCALVNGKAVKLEDPFPLVDVLMPPAHPNCRCTAGLAADRGRVADLAGINLRTHQPLTKAAPKHTDGAMVALRPPAHIVEALRAGGAGNGDVLDAEDFHITVAYLGKAAELDEAAAARAVEAWAVEQRPLWFQVERMAEWDNRAKDGDHVNVAEVRTARETREAQELLIELLKLEGAPADTKWPTWKPHLTVAYDPVGPMPLPREAAEGWTTDTVWLVVGGAWSSFPVGLKKHQAGSHDQQSHGHRGSAAGSGAGTRYSGGEEKVIPASIDGTTMKYGDLEWEANGVVDADGNNPDLDADKWDSVYQDWSYYEGNHAMRLASAALMGEPRPAATPGNDSDVSSVMHDGDTFGVGDAAMRAAKGYVEGAVVGLRAVAANPRVGYELYRGLNEVDATAPIRSVKPGDTLTMPLTAFSTDGASAMSFTTNVGANGYGGENSSRGLMIVLEKGAKAAPGAADSWDTALDQPMPWEFVTEGRYEVVSTAPARGFDPVTHESSVYEITIQQTAYFDIDRGWVNMDGSLAKVDLGIPEWVWAMGGSLAPGYVAKHLPGGHDQKTHGHRGNAGGEQERIAAATARIQAALPNANLSDQSQFSTVRKETLEQMNDGRSVSYNAMVEAGFPKMEWDDAAHGVKLKPTASELEAIADAAENLRKVAPLAADDCRRINFDSLVDDSGQAKNLAQANFTEGGWRLTFDLERTRFAIGEQYGGRQAAETDRAARLRSSSLFRQADSPQAAQRVIAYHEFAHGVAMSGERARLPRADNENVLLAPAPAGLTANANQMALVSHTKSVSQYALVNPGEFFAENVASLWSGINRPHGDTQHWLNEYIHYREGALVKADDDTPNGAISDDFGEEPWLGWDAEILKHQLGHHDQKTHGRRGGGVQADVGKSNEARIADVIAEGGRVDLTGLTQRTADEVTWAMEEFAKKYPEAARSIASVDTRDGNVTPQDNAVTYGAECQVQEADGRVFDKPYLFVGINPVNLQNRTALEMDYALGQSTAQTPYSVIVHELGHVLDLHKQMVANPEAASSSLGFGDMAAHSHIGNSIPGDPRGMDYNEDLQLSGYSQSNIMEAVAEGFVAQWMGPPDASRNPMRWSSFGDMSQQPQWFQNLIQRLAE